MVESLLLLGFGKGRFLLNSCEKGDDPAVILSNYSEQTKVMDQAMKLFWSKGYEATSIEDILEATGLNKNNFYEVFGSKERFYLEAFQYFSF